MNITQSTIARINAEIARKAEKLINDEPLAMDEKQNFKDLFRASKKITEHLREKKDLIETFSRLWQSEAVKMKFDNNAATVRYSNCLTTDTKEAS